ncbi:hypothetical protein A5764_17150 [Mycobacterium sp. 852002-51057_SCH5723018]|nr:hypothetical protein A5764_17150 [Mycobacterium sp. 852002-51057_SCH5723018]
MLAGQESAQLAAINARYPFVARISLGFVEPNIDRADPGLAVIVHICPPVSPFGPDDWQGSLGYLPAGEIFIENGPARTAFPVVPRVSLQDPQVALSSPSKAMLTAWMKIRRSTAPKEGWLLPFHAVRQTYGAAPGLSVSYDDNSTGTVIDSLGNCIDAVVASSSHPPPHAQPCNADNVLPLGLTVTVTDQNGAAWSPTLMDVDVNIGLIGYQKAPIRLTYDWSTSAPGDSGALISHGTTGAPVAMHQGTSWIRDLSGVQQWDSQGNPICRAFGICLFQVAHQLDGEFYL